MTPAWSHQVEVRHRLIKDQQLRLNRQRARQADALQLSAAQLRGALIEHAIIEIHRPEHVACPGQLLRFRQ
ncbi:Uncharacterised protein [Klebsiella michiganensis]|uniref:Uncharacterized protein n=1 Tax=Klebsiella michiganensis TaxID=1134687 RepID=A0A7H4PG37_9ENTR|nr:Uncharacterised protein [Klebsiella michiganensis]